MENNRIGAVSRNKLVTSNVNKEVKMLEKISTQQRNCDQRLKLIKN